MKHTTVKITMDTLEVWFERAVKLILADINDPNSDRSGLRQDYFTASDVEACIRLITDQEAGEDLASRNRAAWWGYQGWCRLNIVDKPYRQTLLDLCRDYLSQQVRDGKLEAHNFGRGHCSGMRFRPAGSGINEAEKKSIEKRAKEKPVHAKVPGDKPSYQRGLLCQEGIVRKPSWTRGRSRTFTRSTDDVSQVTCKRCLKLLKAQSIGSNSTDQTTNV